jgi:hypothetical protein
MTVMDKGTIKMINQILRHIYAIAVFVLMASVSYAEDVIGNVSAVTGDAYAVNDDGSRVDLALKSPIFQNQTVVTGKDGKVQIIFVDNSIFTISANTELLIDEYVYDPKTEQGTSIMNATKGVFKFVTGKIAKNNRDEVKVNTPFATIGVRGSGGIIAVDPALGTRVGLTQCCLEVSTPANQTPVPLDQMGTFIEIEDPDQPAPQPKPVDAAFSRIIQDSFNASFGEDDGSQNPVNQNDQQAGAADGTQKQEKKGPKIAGERDKKPPQKQIAQQGQSKSEPQQQAAPQGAAFDGGLTAEDGAQFDPVAGTQPNLNSNPIVAPIDTPPVDLTAVNQDKADEEVTGGGDNANGPTHFGKFARKDTVAGTIIEGEISGQFLADGKFAARIKDQGNVFNVLLPIDGDGFGARSNVELDGERFNVRFFKNPNDEFFVLNLESLNGGDNIAVFAGEPYSGNLPINGIATYGFVPNFTNENNVSAQNQFDGALYNDYLSRNFIGGNLSTHLDTNGNIVIDGFGAVFGGIDSNSQIGTFAGYENQGAAGSEIHLGTTSSAQYFGTGQAPAGIVMDTTASGQETSLDSFARRPDDAEFTAKTIADRNQTKTYKGFIGGFMSVDADNNGNREYRRLTNSVDSNGFVDRGIEINVNTATGAANNVDAKIEGFLEDGDEAANTNGTTQEIIMAEFDLGTAVNLTAYAAEQQSSGVDAGVVVAGDAMGNTATILGNSTSGGSQQLGGIASDNFGYSTAVSGDWMIVGAPEGDAGATDSGFVQFYKRDQQGNWAAEGSMISSPGAEMNGNFGADVAIDGEWAFVGAKHEDVASVDEGRIYVYHLTATGWEATGQTINGAITSGLLGRNIEVNGDYMVHSSSSGGVSVYQANAGLLSSHGVPVNYGVHDSIAISENGEYFAIGNSSAGSSGEVAVYRFNGVTYASYKTISGDASSDGLGTSIDIKDGKILIGAPVDDRAFIFDLADAGADAIGEEILMIDGGGSNGLGEEVAFNGDRVVLGNSTYNAAGNGGAFKVFTLAEDMQTYTASNLFIGGGSPSTSLGTDLDVADMVISHDNQGVLVSDFVSDYKCTDCDYVHWGIWAGSLENDGLVSAGDLARAEAVYYVAGEMTSPFQLNAMDQGAGAASQASFSGMTAGAIDNAGTLTHHIGDFGANVDFNTRNVNVTTFTLGDYALSSGGASWVAGEEAFAGSLSIDDGTNTLSGPMNGAFFGAAAEDIGGNYSLDNGANINASGIYLGTSQ